jgi:hypothetical protein
MKKILNYIILGIFIATAYSCDEDATGNSVNYVTFEDTTFAFGVDIGGTSTNDIKVYAGNVTGSDRTFSVVVDTDASSLDPAAYTVPSSVTIPGGSNEGALTVQISDTNIGAGGETLVLALADTTEAFTSGPITLNVAQVCPTNEVSLLINFDDYAGETSWEITQGGSVLFSGDGYGGMTSFSTTFCLDDGTYEFTIFDSFGDGICCAYGTGSYTLDLGTTNLASGGSFGASETTSFTLP